MRNFQPTGGDWNTVASVNVSLNGFVAGSNNTITMMGANGNQASDLDWIEVINNGAAGTNYCDISKWVATASASNGAPPQAALDGNVTTRFSTTRFQDGTDWFVVKFPGTVKLSSITLNDGGSSNDSRDYPGGYALYGSTDGTNFGSMAIATGSGTPNQTLITFPQQSLKAIKIMQTGTANSASWWSIDELQTNCSQ